MEWIFDLYNKSQSNISQFLEEFVTKVVCHATLVLSNNGPVVFFSWRVVPRCGMEANTRAYFGFLQILANSLQDIIQIILVVVIGHRLDIEVDPVILLTIEVIKIV